MSLTQKTVETTNDFIGSKNAHKTKRTTPQSSLKLLYNQKKTRYKWQVKRYISPKKDSKLLMH